jgi:coenzyme F420-reducing hydrogenase gamma subunit
VTDLVEIANFAEASRAMMKGPYDVALVEGSITTPHDAERVHQIRRSSKLLVTIGACATSGGIQALRNFADVRDWLPMVYATPGVIETLRTSTPISNHVAVDFELHGCPISKRQLIDAINALVHGRRPALPTHSVCTDCKLRGATCVMVAQGAPCLGPVTRSGCGALCPSYGRGCYGCFGPLKHAPVLSLGARLAAQGQDADALVRLFRSFNAGAEPFRRASEAYERHTG